jgi:hypothetical protein
VNIKSVAKYPQGGNLAITYIERSFCLDELYNKVHSEGSFSREKGLFGEIAHIKHGTL